MSACCIAAQSEADSPGIGRRTEVHQLCHRQDWLNCSIGKGWMGCDCLGLVADARRSIIESNLTCHHSPEAPAAVLL